MQQDMNLEINKPSNLESQRQIQKGETYDDNMKIGSTINKGCDLREQQLRARLLARKYEMCKLSKLIRLDYIIFQTTLRQISAHNDNNELHEEQQLSFSSSEFELRLLFSD
ncbi:glucose-6-phosphate isomerase [Striga asiatica]|uniref:Glucose-6-phosphate isomerase n=1 Tax=Striga asiatica TaxID=4170 RepID=A0A5A7PIM9_STRAF|nr:glucose-6-phosphate isomerase [Striga asiatica]